MSEEPLRCWLADTFGGNPEVQRRNDRAGPDYWYDFDAVPESWRGKPREPEHRFRFVVRLEIDPVMFSCWDTQEIPKEHQGKYLFQYVVERLEESPPAQDNDRQNPLVFALSDAHERLCNNPGEMYDATKIDENEPFDIAAPSGPIEGFAKSSSTGENAVL